jgi:hypothetical protein
MAGYIYDHMGGYGPFLLIGTVGCAIGGVLMITLPPKRVFKEEGDAALFA